MYVYWGWIVCLSFLILFTLSAGVAFSFGEMMIPITKEVNASMSLLTWVGALPGSIPMLAAPLTTWLYYRSNARHIVFAGVLVTSLALAWMAFASHVVSMLVVYGLLGGVGLLLVVNPPFFLIDDYFPYEHPRHVLATSIVACGYPLATLIFNPVSFALISSIGWRSTYLVYGGLMFVIGSAACATFRPHNHAELLYELGHTNPKYPTVVKQTEDGKDLSVDIEYTEIPSTTSCDSEVCPTGSLSLYNTHTVLEEPQPLEGGLEQQNERHQLHPVMSGCIPTRTKIIVGTVWFLASTLKSMGYYTPIIILVKQMELMGIAQWQSSRAMAVIGSCEVVSRLVTSYVGDRFKGKILYVYVVCTLVLCLQNALGTLAYTYDHLLIYSAGIFGGPIIAAMYSSCSEVLDGQHVPALFSLFRAGLGLGGMLGPTLAGAIYDTTGSFNGVFYVNCATYAVTSLLYAFIVLVNCVRPGYFYPKFDDAFNVGFSRMRSFDSTSSVSDCTDAQTVEWTKSLRQESGTWIGTGVGLVHESSMFGPNNGHIMNER